MRIMTPAEFAAWCERVAGGLPDLQRDEMLWALAEVQERAEDYSSGPVSRAELRRMGHPYARAERGQPRLDPSEINVQRGDLVSQWDHSDVTDAGGDLFAAVFNTSPEVRFLYDPNEPPKHADRGTETMVGRPLPDRVAAEVEPQAMARFEKAVEALLRK